MKQQSFKMDFSYSMRTKMIRSGTWLAMMGLFSGCAINPQPTPLAIITLARATADFRSGRVSASGAAAGSGRSEKRPLCRYPGTQQVRYVEPVVDNLGKGLQGDPISVNVNNFPLPAFINEVFGNRLGLSFVVSPELQRKMILSPCE